ncbi:MAG: ABC-type transport auxiliary lipoprotein family protein [Kofleriaceae bacterium]
MRLVLLLTLLVACGGTVPNTRYYQLAIPTQRTPGGDLTLVLEPLVTDSGYDDERIVYRTTPYRLDYYQYHRWSAAPGTLIGNYLEQALERSGRFRAVVREASSDAPAVLGGRVVAIEEVDLGPKQWVGRIVVELALTDPRNGVVLWSEQFEETEPLAKQSPEGLAQALSTAMARIASRAAPAIATATEQASSTAVARNR